MNRSLRGFLASGMFKHFIKVFLLLSKHSPKREDLAVGDKDIFVFNGFFVKFPEFLANSATKELRS